MREACHKGQGKHCHTRYKAIITDIAHKYQRCARILSTGHFTDTSDYGLQPSRNSRLGSFRGGAQYGASKLGGWPSHSVCRDCVAEVLAWIFSWRVIHRLSLLYWISAHVKPWISQEHTMRSFSTSFLSSRMVLLSILRCTILSTIQKSGKAVANIQKRNTRGVCAWHVLHHDGEDLLVRCDGRVHAWEVWLECERETGYSGPHLPTQPILIELYSLFLDFTYLKHASGWVHRVRYCRACEDNVPHESCHLNGVEVQDRAHIVLERDTKAQTRDKIAHELQHATCWTRRIYRHAEGFVARPKGRSAGERPSVGSK